jgi:hypothetical protein
MGAPARKRRQGTRSTVRAKLEAYLDAYIATAGIADDKDGPLFRTTGRFTGTPHRMTQQDGYRMIQRRARQAGKRASAIIR